MYSNAHATMPPPQSRSVAPETFLLDQEAQNSLPPESIVALQQVDNRVSHALLNLNLANVLTASQ
jgi:transcription factor STE12